MSETIIKSRITQPGLAKGIVHRTRLINQLKANLDKSLLLICTSAGFGKTTLANDFLNVCGFKHAWFYTSSDINSFYTFFLYIVQSLKLVEPKFGENTLQIIKTLQKEAGSAKNYKNVINDCTGTFANEFANHFNDDIILVIDDLHNIDESQNGEWLNFFFDVFFDNIPQNLRLLITTRDIPGFNITKLKAKRRFFQLTSEDLNFDDEEISELLEIDYSIKSTRKDIELLQSSIHGWVTGIHLVLQAYGRDFVNIRPGRKQDYADIFNYFAKDIFEQLDISTREFMLNTSILENFDSAICDYLMNIQNSSKIIDGLISKNIFIELSGLRDSAGEKYTDRYNYQELFKLFLQSKLRELKTKEEICIQFKKLSGYYLNNNEIVLAVNYGLKAEDYSAVIPLVIENYQTLFEKGSYDTLWQWLNMMPADIVNSNQYLLYLTGLLYLYFRSDPQKSHEYLNKALAFASVKKDFHLIVDCNILKTDTALLLGTIENLKDELREIIQLRITNNEKARLLYQISRLLFREGQENYNEMIEILTEAIEICNAENTPSLKTDLFTMLGNIYSDWGDLVKSAHYYEQALMMDSNVFNQFRVLNNIVRLYCQMGEYAKAKKYIDKSNNFFKNFPSLYFRRYFLRSLANSCFEIGDLEESIRINEELNKLELKNNIKLYAGVQFLNIGEAYYYLKKYDAALKNYELSLNYINKNNKHHLIIRSYLTATVHLKTQMNEDTEQMLLEYLEYHEKNKIILICVQGKFQLANYYLITGSNESALEYLKNSLETAAGKQFVSFFEYEVFSSRPLFDMAITNNIQKQFIKTIFENIRNKINYEWLSVDYKKRLCGEIESLTDLKLYSFGKTEIHLRGKPVPEAKWTRKKSKDILAYLLAKPGMMLNKDKIVDLFFQDVPSENADTIFHNTISNIRSAVKITYKDYIVKTDSKGTKAADVSKHAPQLVIYESKNLSLNSDFYYDADCIEFEKLFNRANSASSKTKEKIEASVKAVELYKGEFMPGNYEPWCEEMRENFSNMYQKLCEGLIDLYFKSGDYQNTINYAEKLLEADKLHADAYLKIIESSVKLNNINTAKNKFALMLKIYDEELGEKPDKTVLNIIKNILSNN